MHFNVCCFDFLHNCSFREEGNRFAVDNHSHKVLLLTIKHTVNHHHKALKILVNSVDSRDILIRSCDRQ